MNGQPWHFIIVEDLDTLKKLTALARSGPYIAQAPLSGPGRYRASAAMMSSSLRAWISRSVERIPGLSI